MFGNRGHNLKGHVNPHYWNDAMQAFFNNLDAKIDQKGSPLQFTEEDLKKFRQRHGAHYAQVHMGLRLCWWIPSGMPHDHDALEKFAPTMLPAGWQQNMGALPPEIFKWYTKPQYGNEKLIAAYKKISNNPAHNEKMRQKFLQSKAHVYVSEHLQPPVYRL